MRFVRLDKYILERHGDFSRSRIEGLVKAGFVKVNGIVAAKAGMKISEADEVTVEIPPPVPSEIIPEDIPLEIIFEDGDIVVINKKAGLVVHPAPGHHSGTLVNALLHHCPDLSGIGSVARPGLVHRLDQDTSGVMVVAKSQRAMEMLVKDFSTHTNLKKTYLAISHPAPSGSRGFLQRSGRVETLIGRHPVDRKKMAIVEKNGKNAITNWSILTDCWEMSEKVVAVRCDIETGRTHQIRVHLASLGMPIVGDKVYGKSQLDNRLAVKVDRQMLHAWKLNLRHPVTRRDMEFVAPVPKDMRWAIGL